MMQTLDGDKRIMPVDMLMIVQAALCLNIMSVTTKLYETIWTTWWGYDIVVDLLLVCMSEHMVRWMAENRYVQALDLSPGFSDFI